MSLTFDELRKANINRLPLFKDAKGRRAHSKKDGSDWPLSKWNNAILGELGELANLIKKYERGDFKLDDICDGSYVDKSPMTFHDWMAQEIADVQIYLDLLAYQLRVDLGEATRDKFNIVSDRVGVNVKL